MLPPFMRLSGVVHYYKPQKTKKLVDIMLRCFSCLTENTLFSGYKDPLRVIVLLCYKIHTKHVIALC